MGALKKGEVTVTLVEYLEVNKMTQVELAKLTGVPVESINRYINHGGGFSPKYTHALRTVGIDIKNKREREINGFDQFKFSVQYTLNATKKADVIYCWTNEQVDYATKCLNRRKIAYYSYYKDCYWVIHYDKSLDIEERVC